NVVAPAFFTAIESESLSHTVFRSDEVTTIDFDSVSEQWARYHRYDRSCPDSFLLALLLALACGRFPTPCRTCGWNWRRRSESNGFSGNHYSRTTPRHQRRT